MLRRLASAARSSAALRFPRDVGSRWGGAGAARQRCSPALDAGASTPAADAGTWTEPPLPFRFTSDMRPPGDTSRKWVKVDDLGRAYSTGRRKKAIARVWVWEAAATGDEPASVRALAPRENARPAAPKARDPPRLPSSLHRREELQRPISMQACVLFTHVPCVFHRCA
jgi:hypothetical protein